MVGREFSFIYKTTNLINNKIYVGQHSTNDLKDGYIGSGVAFSNSIKKHGKENFKREILEHCIPCIYFLNNREIYWIKKLDAKNKKNGYNLADGGAGAVGYKMPQEAKDKLSKLAKLRVGALNPSFGKKCSESMKEKLRQANLGKKHSEETKRKLSKSNSGEKNGFYGKVHSEETRKKMSEAKKDYIPWSKGKKFSKETRRKISEKAKGRIVSQETRDKISKANKGHVCSKEQRLKISKANKGKVRSEEVRKGMSERAKLRGGDKHPNYGKKLSEETKNKISKAHKNRPIIICPHCELESKGSANMKRYHFDNCKF